MVKDTQLKPSLYISKKITGQFSTVIFILLNIDNCMHLIFVVNNKDYCYYKIKRLELLKQFSIFTEY